MDMKKLLIPAIALTLVACSSNESKTLKAENEALRLRVQQQREIAERAHDQAMMAQAEAIIAQRDAEAAAEWAREAQMEAEKHREAALKALKDCQGK